MHDPAIEARTQQLGSDLLRRIDRRRPRAAERLQDWLLEHALGDERFRTRMLRFIDVFAAVDATDDAEELHRLLGEYFDEDFPEIPRLLRWLVRIGRDPLTPSTAVSEAARRSVSLFARRFITSPHQGATHELTDELSRAGRTPSFDLLGEAVLSESEAAAYETRYLRMIEDLRTHPQARQRTRSGLPALQVSLKLSALTHRFTPIDVEGSIDRVEPRLTRIATAARAAGIGICVDAEQYEARDVVWGAFQRVFGRGGPLGTWDGAGMVVQAYLRDADAHLDDVLAFAARRGTPFQVRLVKGAYWDHETIVATANRWTPPVFQLKSATDRMYEALTERLVDAVGVVSPAIASHNPRSHALAEALAEQRGLPPGTVEHQTLHRTLEVLSEALAANGWATRDYVPVGELIPGMAYLVRRILENSSQAGFLMMSRAHADAGNLLAPPSEQPDPAEVPPDGAPFERAPAARWFDSDFRTDFQAALDAALHAPPQQFTLAAGIEAQERHAVFNPSHPDRVIGEVDLASPQGARTAVERATSGAADWGARAVEERAQILRRAADLLLARGHEFAAAVVVEGGRDRAGAWAEVEEAVDFLRLYAQAAEDLWRTHGEVIAPRGVVAVIPPWNFSLAIPCGMTAAALACGNAAILKPAEPTPLIARRLIVLLHEAGVPEDATIWLPAPGRTSGSVLVEHPDVAMTSFTGSRSVGTWMHEAIAATPARDGRPRVLTAEMGGKNPVIVFSDADLDEAVDGVLHSAFGHAGQKCSAASRVLVERAIYERFRDRLVDAARSWRSGAAEDAATSINPIINAEAAERLQEAASRARTEGRVLLDEFRPVAGTLAHGPLIVEVDAERALTAKTTTEELFGPILALIPFDDDDTAYRIANGTAYGLTAGLFSRSPTRIARATEVIDAGHLYVNRTTTGARPGVEPFGGHRFSGTGPKAGYVGTLWAYVRWMDAPALGEARGESSPAVATGVTLPATWDVPLAVRIAAIERAADALERAAASGAGALRAVAQAAHAELGAPEPTVQAAGQDTRMRFDVPLGAGVIRATGPDAPWWLAAAVVAGNGVLVCDSAALASAVHALLAAGVPQETLRTEDGDVWHALGVAAMPGVDFAAIDSGPAGAFARALGPTPEGQRGLKALLSPLDGPQPGDPGFLQRFAWPRVTAIRTLRHGADLGFADD